MKFDFNFTIGSINVEGVKGGHATVGESHVNCNVEMSLAEMAEAMKNHREDFVALGQFLKQDLAKVIRSCGEEILSLKERNDNVELKDRKAQFLLDKELGIVNRTVVEG